MHNPYLMLEVALDRQRELIDEADRERLLTAARRRRRANGRRPGLGRDTGTGPRNRTDGSLAPCGARAAAPAR